MSPEVLDGTIWIGVMAIAILIEIITIGMTSIWFAGGALIASIAAFCGADVTVQIIIFMVVSVALLLAIRPLVKKKLKIKTTATNVDELIGEKYKTLTDIGPGRETGEIRIHDVEWRAVSEDGSEIPAGSTVTIRKIDGTKLVVTADQR